MPRIYKGSETTLRLLVHTCTYEGKISDLKIALFTNDPNVAVEFTDRYTIEGNIVTLTVPNYAFGSMEDGVINYIAQGMIDDDTFLTQRQSNYFLKTPANYNPTPMPEEVVLGELAPMITENGVFEYTPTDVDAWNKATIEVNVPQEGGSCNLGEGEIYLTASDAGFYELYAAEDGYDGWSKFYVTLENGGAIKIHRAEELIQMFNDGGGIDFGAYYYVGGKITEIEEINTEFGNATYVLDNGFSVYRGKWFDGNLFGEDQIKVGAYIVVYGIIQEHNGVLGFKVNSQVIAYQECEGGEIVSCNLEDKWVTPSMADRDGNGYVIAYPSEGFDGLSRVVFDPTTIYNEGVTAGKAEGGDLTIGTGDIFLGASERGQRFEIFPSEWGYDAFDKFIVELENFDLGGDTNIYDALSVHQLLMDGVISYDNRYIFKGQITEIQRIRPEYGDARYTIDGSLNVYNGQTMGYDLQVGDNVIVYGNLSEYNGAPQFSAGSEIKAWWREGGGSGECNIQNQKWVELNDPWEVFSPDEGYDGIYEVIVDASRKADEWQEDGRNEVRNKLQTIDITENGRYSVDDHIEKAFILFDGNSYFDTGIVPTEQTKIEVMFRCQGEIWYEDMYILGCSQLSLHIGGTALYGKWAEAQTGNIPYFENEWTTATFDRDNLCSNNGCTEWNEGNKDSGWGGYNETIKIGKLGDEQLFKQQIACVKIWVNKYDDSTMTLFTPKNMEQGGFSLVNSDGIEYNYISNLGEGTTTFISEWERKYGEGWREINVNIPTIQDSAKDYYYCPLILGDSGFGEASKSWDTDMVTFNNYDGDIIDDKLYVPTFGNKNEFRTKEKARFVQRLPSDVSIFGSMEFGDGIEYFVTTEEKKYTNLTDLTIGPDMNTVNFGTSTFPTLRRIWCFSETDNIDVYFSLGSSFYDAGTLYLKNHNQETEWRNSLPNGWTIVLL